MQNKKLTSIGAALVLGTAALLGGAKLCHGAVWKCNPTPTPVPTATAAPTATQVVVTSTPTPTRTPTPIAVPTPTVAPTVEPIPTPIPTPIVIPTPTPVQSCTVPPVWTQIAPPPATLNAPYSYQFRALGADTYLVTGGSLPPVISLNINTGLASGTPVFEGTYIVHLRADNACGTSYQFSISITVQASVQPMPVSSDPLVALRVREAWQYTNCNPISVAVLDTGVQWEHPDLAGKVTTPGFYAPRFTTAQDGMLFGHGTMMAGIIAAIQGNGQGIDGVACGARILPVKVCDDHFGTCLPEDEVLGLNWAVDNGAKIVNLSTGHEAYHAPMQAAINNAVSRGVLVVVSAGNGGPTDVGGYPTLYDNVLVVGAIDETGDLANFSSRVPVVDVVAPGKGILSTGCLTVLDEPGIPCPVYWPDGMVVYSNGSGTSQATAFVSGVATLLRGLPRNWCSCANDVQFLTNTITQTAKPIGVAGSGSGLVDALAAVQRGLLP